MWREPAHALSERGYGRGQQAHPEKNASAGCTMFVKLSGNILRSAVRQNPTSIDDQHEAEPKKAYAMVAVGSLSGTRIAKSSGIR